jgi:hypothetical protein
LVYPAVRAPGALRPHRPQGCSQRRARLRHRWQLPSVADTQNGAADSLARPYSGIIIAPSPIPEECDVA